MRGQTDGDEQVSGLMSPSARHNVWPGDAMETDLEPDAFWHGDLVDKLAAYLAACKYG